MLPLLRIAGDGKEHFARDTIDTLSKQFSLTEEEKNAFLPSGKSKIFYDRVHWALSYLRHSMLLSSPRRGFFQITERGKEVLKQNPNGIDNQFLRQFPEFVDYVGFKTANEESTPRKERESTGKTPEEVLEDSFQLIVDSLSRELLQTVKDCDPRFFEMLVIGLLVKMGYGGSIPEAGKVIGKSGDEGIDGIIKEDRLGLDVIYLQAKKWDGTIGRPEIQKFAGALQGRKAKKGIFITTGTFSYEAKDFAEKIDSKIVLIDGKQLSQYMIDHNIGVSADKSYVVKKINSDYFEQL